MPDVTPTKRVLTVAEFCRDYGISKTFAYQHMNEGKLRSLKIGAKRVITTDAAEEWLASMAVAA
jgi:excisionase family DNA binding protein